MGALATWDEGRSGTRSVYTLLTDTALRTPFHSLFSCPPLVHTGFLAASTVDTYTVHTSTENITTALTQSATTR